LSRRKRNASKRTAPSPRIDESSEQPGISRGTIGTYAASAIDHQGQRSARKWELPSQTWMALEAARSALSVDFASRDYCVCAVGPLPGHRPPGQPFQDP
jgi:hypothetical protein